MCKTSIGLITTSYLLGELKTEISFVQFLITLGVQMNCNVDYDFTNSWISHINRCCVKRSRSNLLFFFRILACSVLTGRSTTKFVEPPNMDRPPKSGGRGFKAAPIDRHTGPKAVLRTGLFGTATFVLMPVRACHSCGPRVLGF